MLMRSGSSLGGSVRLCPAGVFSLKTGGARANSTARGQPVYRLLSKYSAADDVELAVACVLLIFVLAAGRAGFAF